MGVGTEPIEQKELTVEKLSVAIDTAVHGREIRNRATQLGQQIRSENGVENAVQAIAFNVKLA